jgi:hypothetical protein
MEGLFLIFGETLLALTMQYGTPKAVTFKCPDLQTYSSEYLGKLAHEMERHPGNIHSNMMIADYRQLRKECKAIEK